MANDPMDLGSQLQPSGGASAPTTTNAPFTQPAGTPALGTYNGGGMDILNARAGNTSMSGMDTGTYNPNPKPTPQTPAPTPNPTPAPAPTATQPTPQAPTQTPVSAPTTGVNQPMGGITQDQYGKMNDTLHTLMGQGMSYADAVGKMKQDMLASGQYGKGQALYQQGQTPAGQTQPGQPTNPTATTDQWGKAFNAADAGIQSANTGVTQTSDELLALNKKQQNTEDTQRQNAEEATALSTQREKTDAQIGADAQTAMRDANYAATSADSKQKIDEGKQALDNTRNAFNDFNGAGGRVPTATFTEAKNNLDKAYDYLNFLDTQYSSNATIFGQEAIEAHAHLQKTIDDYNSQLHEKVNSAVINALVTAHKIDAVGDMDSPEAIEKANADLGIQLGRDLSDATDKYNIATKLLADQVTQKQELQKEYLTQASENGKFNNDASLLRGVLTSNDGNPILDANGQPIKFDPTGAKSIIDSMGYQGPDPVTHQLVSGVWVEKLGGGVEFRPTPTVTLQPGEIGSKINTLTTAMKSGDADAKKIALSELDALSPGDRDAILSQLPTEVSMKIDEERQKQVVEGKLFDTDPRNRQDGILGYINSTIEDLSKATGNQIQFTRTPIEIAGAVEKRVEAGEDVGTAIQDEFWGKTTAKPEYQQAFDQIKQAAQLKIQQDQADLAQKQAQTADTQAGTGYKNVQTNMLGGAVGPSTLSSKGQSLINIPDGGVAPNGRTQCGEFVNDCLGTPGKFGDTLDSKVAAVNSQVPVINGAVVMSSTGKFGPNGHVGIVVSQDADTITVKSSNYNGDGTVSTDTFQKDDPRIKGYYAPESVYNSPLQNKAQEDMAQQVAAGTAKLNDLVKGQGIPAQRERELINSRALAINKDYASYDNATQANMIKGWNTGDDSKKNRNLKQATDHLEHLSELIPNLSNDSVQRENQLVNFFQKELGKPEITDFNTLKQAFTTEMASTLKGTTAAPTKEEEAAWQGLIGSDFSPEQLKGQVKMAAGVLKPRYEGQVEDFKQVFKQDPFEFKGGQYGLTLGDARDNLSKILGVDMSKTAGEKTSTPASKKAPRTIGGKTYNIIK